MEKSYWEKLTRLVYVLLVLALVITACWYFREILLYIVLASVIALLAIPMRNRLVKISIKGHGFPVPLAAILSLTTVTLIILALTNTIIPLLVDVGHDISLVNVSNVAQSAIAPLTSVNEWIIANVPKVGPDFTIQSVLVEKVQSILDMSDMTTVVGSVTSFVVKLLVTFVASLVISYFFIENPAIISSIVTSFVPDKYEIRVRKSLKKVRNEVSRYLIGVFLQILAVVLLDFLGLFIFAKLGVKYSLCIAFMAGVMIVIPQIGAALGTILGIALGVVIKFACVSSVAVNVELFPFMLLLLVIFVAALLINKIVFEPLVWTTAIRVGALEAFLVTLIAAKYGGMLTMIAAFPLYVVGREIAREFFGNVKAIRRLTDYHISKNGTL